MTKVIRWQYGVTTVPERRYDLLPKTLESLARAGFDKPRLFVDGDDDPDGFSRFFGKLEISARFPRIRAYGNWILGIAELYIRDPYASHYAIFQDDFLTYRNLRQYLERIPIVEKTYWNLYTFPSNQRLCPMVNGKPHVGFYPSNQLGRGAVGLVFSRDAVKDLLECQSIVNKPLDPSRGYRTIDGAVQTALVVTKGYRELVHNPSLTQHFGDVTTIQKNPPHHKAVSWKGENFDALSLLQ